MKNLKKIIIIVLLLTKTSYSQNLLITETQRDSIYSKIIRGNAAIENNKVLKVQIKKRDSVITLQQEIIAAGSSTIGMQKTIISNLNIVINNKDLVITNEKKRGRKKGWNNLFKGIGIGFGMALLILN